jgi:chemotaxis protein MotB
MTSLFAVFVVLFASSNRDNQEIKKLSHAIHTGFQQLGAFSTGSNGRDASDVRLQPSPSDTMPAIPPKHDLASAATGIDVAELQRQLEAAIGQELRNHEVVMRVTPEGFVVSLKDLGFFNSGQAVLLPGAAEKIKRIANVLSQNGMDLRIEGHSDDQPIHTPQFRSNWELSTARAMTVLLLLVNDSGIDPGKVSVAGYGQYRPVADNATSDGRQMNRRVDLVVVATIATQQKGH